MPDGRANNRPPGRADSLRGTVNSVKSRKAWLRLEKLRLKLQQKNQWLDPLKSLGSNPAAVGTILFIGVYELWTPGAVQAATGTTTQQANVGLLQQVLNDIGLVIPGVGNGGTNSLSGLVNGLAPDIAKAVILGALAAYTASGGNLAGTLQQASGLASTVIKGVESGAATA